MFDDSARRFWEDNALRYDRSMALLGGPLPRTLKRVEACDCSTGPRRLRGTPGHAAEAALPVVRQPAR